MGYPIQIMVGMSTAGIGMHDAIVELTGQLKYRIHHIQLNNDLATADLEEAAITLFAKLNPNTSTDPFVRLAEGRATYMDGLHFEGPIDVQGPCSIHGQIIHVTSINHTMRVYVEMLGK